MTSEHVQNVFLVLPFRPFTLRWVMIVAATLACGLAFPPLLFFMLVVGSGFLTAILVIPVFLVISRIAGPVGPPPERPGVWDWELDS